MADIQLNHGLSDKTIITLKTVFKTFSKIKSVILYGSRANGHYHQGSDIDFAISAPEMNDNEFSTLWDTLDSLPIIYKLDCLHLEKLENQSLRDNINQQGVIFFVPL